MSIDILHAVDNLTLEQQESLDRSSEQVQKLLNSLVASGGPVTQGLKDFLNGTWLGHPLHPVLTDLPIGAWSTGALLDLLGSDHAADTAFGLGVLAAVPTALSGAADWDDLEGEPRRTGLLHALLNSAGLAFIVGSLVARRANRRGLGIMLSGLGLSCTSAAAWLGGRLVYSLGTGVSRTAFEPLVDDFTVVAPAKSVHDGELVAGEVEVGGARVPLVLLKRGASIAAIGATCTHAAGNLADGKLVDEECVECPLHGSRFSLNDGRVTRGPASTPAPVFEVRERAGNIEVRRQR